MIITWYGQSCFKIQTKDVALYTDPFDKTIGLRPPQGIADLVTVSHEHYDHNNIQAFKDIGFLVNMSGEYAVKGLNILGIESLHSQETEENVRNTIFTINAEDVSICHLGDLGEILSDEQLEKIGSVDILFVPVGEKYTLSVHDVIKVISEIEPKIVIPMHYKVEGLNIDLENIDKFVKEVGLSPGGTDKLVIKAKDLGGSGKMRLVILEKV